MVNVEGNGGSFEGHITVDNDLGRETEFIFDYSGSDVHITLIDASGHMHAVSKHDDIFGIYRFSPPGIAEVRTAVFCFIK